MGNSDLALLIDVVTFDQLVSVIEDLGPGNLHSGNRLRARMQPDVMTEQYTKLRSALTWLQKRLENNGEIKVAVSRSGDPELMWEKLTVRVTYEGTEDWTYMIQVVVMGDTVSLGAGLFSYAEE